MNLPAAGENVFHQKGWQTSVVRTSEASAFSLLQAENFGILCVKNSLGSILAIKF